MKKEASPEARDKMAQADRTEIWTATCRFCGKPERGTIDDMRTAAKRHGIGRCKELPNGAQNRANPSA